MLVLNCFVGYPSLNKLLCASNGWLISLKVCLVGTNFPLWVKMKYIEIEEDEHFEERLQCFWVKEILILLPNLT